MNTNNNERHFSHDELLRAIVDIGDLAADRRSHLADCPSCSQALERNHDRLKRIGKMAQKASPTPSRSFRIPQRSSLFPVKLKPVWVMGIAAALLLAIVVAKPQWLMQQGRRDLPTFNAKADQQFMDEVNALVHDALPTDFQQLAALGDATTIDNDVDDDLLDWIVPSIDDEESDESIL